MNLKRRLERLTGSAVGGVAAAPSSGVYSVPAPLEAANPSTTESPSRSDRERTLDELRRQMQALIGRGDDAAAAAPARRARSPLAMKDLPFSSRPTASGLLWQRSERLEPSHPVGRVTADAAWRADPRVLAELALDPRVADTSPESWLFIDTETTGLGGAGTLVFLVGLAAIEPSGAVVVEQLLLVEPHDEVSLLDRLRERVEASSLLISFNGKAFDRPMLDGRLVLNRLPALPARQHFDLLHVGRRLHARRLGCCTLKRVESEVLGLDRGDDIDGSEVGPIYSHFLRSADARGLADVVAHNFQDVVSMVGLIGLYGQRTPGLVAQDMAGLARTLKRAGATRHAEHVADIACEGGGGAEAYRVRAELAKSRGDCSSAVQDFERLCRESDDPSGRLELVKLYEHKLRQPARALHWLSLGTSETGSDQQRRRERLERKLRRGPTA